MTNEDLGKDYQVLIEDRWHKVRLIGLTITGLAVLQEPEWVGGQVMMARVDSDKLRPWGEGETK